ncbi:MAG: RNA methyltransferase [Desulfovibrio sp.]|jgi:tRNA (guanosine-2'-O-)-methyltransferase|nr:RNA methyltransferase [Desulfovibrio sp.]
MPREITPRRLERIRSVLRRRQKDLTLVMDNIWDPHNVSAVLRSCDAFGVLGVHLYYTTSSWPDLGKKSSASALKWVDRTQHTDARAMVEGLRSQGYQIVRTGFSETAREPCEYDLTRPTAIILSNEHHGTAPELVELVSDEIYIPMQGMIQSFNVSVAAALMLYEAYTQREAQGMYDLPSLTEQELREHEALWVER